ncbi:MAG: hypothetical protein ACW99G_00375 [Candidatus Thorarchaeota archaeon]|jgi:hypothetical protein
MKKVVFLASHLYSGSSTLVEILNDNSRIQIHKSDLLYDHPTVLNHLYALGHKWETTASVYGDHLLNNTSFSCKELYPLCKFIYFVRHPDEALGEIVANKPKYTWETAARYYCFRLRRICEMATKTPGAIFLTRENIKEGLEPISEYLNLKDPLVLKEYPEEKSEYIPSDILESCEQSYEKHLFYVKHLDLRLI